MELLFHDTYYVLYVNDQESERFLKTLPPEYQKQVSQQLKGKKQKGKFKYGD